MVAPQQRSPVALPEDIEQLFSKQQIKPKSAHGARISNVGARFKQAASTRPSNQRQSGYSLNKVQMKQGGWMESLTVADASGQRISKSKLVKTQTAQVGIKKELEAEEVEKRQQVNRPQESKGHRDKRQQSLGAKSIQVHSTTRNAKFVSSPLSGGGRDAGQKQQQSFTVLSQPQKFNNRGSDEENLNSFKSQTLKYPLTINSQLGDDFINLFAN